MDSQKNTEKASSHGVMPVVVILLLIANSLGLGALYYKVGNLPKTVSDSIRADKYAEYGGQDVYDLATKAAKLSASDQKSRMEAAIKQLEGKNGNSSSDAPAVSKNLTDDQLNALKKNSFVEGNKDAKFTMIEFSDLECPFCIMQYKQGTIAAMKKKFGNDVNVIYKTVNLAGHPGGDQKALSALCVGKDNGVEKFAKFYQTVLGTSDEQSRNYAGFTVDKLEPLAKQVGADMAKFKKCMDDKAMSDVYAEYRSEASEYRVNGTPSTMIINNQTKAYELVEGAAPASQFEAAFDKLSK